MEALDEHLFRVCYAGTTAGGTVWVVMVVATVVGSGWTMIALVPFLVRDGTRRVAAELGVTLLVCAAVVFSVKMLVARARPCMHLVGVRALFGQPTDFSFPSGHAAGSFCVAAFVGAACLRRARTDRKNRRLLLGVAAALTGIAAVIAYSRVYLGAHYPGDVAGGALIGAVIGLTGARVQARGSGALASRAPADPE